MFSKQAATSDIKDTNLTAPKRVLRISYSEVSRPWLVDDLQMEVTQSTHALPHTNHHTRVIRLSLVCKLSGEIR